MHFTSVGFVAVLAATAVSLSTSNRHVLHEKRDAAPKQWMKRSVVSKNTKLPMRIGLTQSNIDNGVGDQLLHEMYDI
jgi:tripeptidyl-peptidase-1